MSTIYTNNIIPGLSTLRGQFVIVYIHFFPFDAQMNDEVRREEIILLIKFLFRSSKFQLLSLSERVILGMFRLEELGTVW